MDQVSGRQSTLKRAIALTAVVLVVEVAGGLLSHSLALLSDAGHVLTDVFALGLAWFALAQSRRPADRRRSYGYQRVTVLAALVNAVTLIVIVLAIGFEAVRRLMAPEPVQGGIVIASALVGIAVNAYVIFGLRGEASPGGGKSLNMRAAFLHVAGDIGASVGVLVAGAVILLTGWLYIDPLLSLAIAVLIAYGAWGIVRETVNLRRARSTSAMSPARSPRPTVSPGCTTCTCGRFLQRRPRSASTWSWASAPSPTPSTWCATSSSACAAGSTSGTRPSRSRAAIRAARSSTEPARTTTRMTIRTSACE